MSVPADFHGSLTACSILGCSYRSLLRYVADGFLPGYKPAGRLRFRVSDLDDYIERSRVRPSDA